MTCETLNLVMIFGFVGLFTNHCAVGSYDLLYDMTDLVTCTVVRFPMYVAWAGRGWLEE